jgi:hypothetical protein
MQITDILLATVFIALALSFAYKAMEAVFFGRTYYWAGWLPIGIFSPFFIHWPPNKNSLIKRIHHWFIHLTLGPAFILCALVCASVGMDKLGFDGTSLVNYVLTMPFLPRHAGAVDPGPAITFSKEQGYKFPILGRMQTAIFGLLTKPIAEKDADSLTGDASKDSQSQGDLPNGGKQEDQQGKKQ